MKMHWIIIVFFLVIVAVKGISQSDLLREYIEIQQQRLHFNGVVLVTKNNRPLYSIAVGKASQELNVPMISSAVFRVASVSKQFTAMLVALAMQEKRLHPEDSLAMFFPSLKDTAWRHITIHQLLSHTSGIPHNEGISDYWTIKSRLPLTKEQALAEIFNTKLLFTAGAGMSYSSPGYFLLASILESVYKCSYEKLLSEKILQPLQMNRTGIYHSGEIIQGMVAGYHLLSDSLIAAPYRDYSFMKGSGDLYSNADDLAKWNNSFSDNNIWSEGLRKMLFTVYTQESSAYGYGWFYRPGKRSAWYHGGGSFGCSALSAWYPEEKISITILSNVSVLPVNELWNDIEKIIFNEPIGLPVLTKAVSINKEALKKVTGSYVQGQQELNILLVNDQLYARQGAHPPFELYPESSVKFFGKKVNVVFTFITDGEGNVVAVEASGRGEVYHFKKQ